ncbi:hypothetical protein [Streptomyces cyaneofuscatus]|uniref:hypothetical protein n=1 Tax=Streptomyces cyaneofuscatus TaxID=66883 RepID=UPI00342C577D
MSVGFRPTPEDTEIIRAHQRPDESTSDVLRRALRALDRERWEQEARADMERIATEGEDLSDEPDEWGYDDTGTPTDLRHIESRSSRAVVPAVQRAFGGSMEADAGHVQEHLSSSWRSEVTRVRKILGDTSDVWAFSVPSKEWTFAIRPFPSEELESLGCSFPAHPASAAMAAAMASDRLPGIDRSAARHIAEERHPATWKLAHLRAAARRRAGKR